MVHSVAMILYSAIYFVVFNGMVLPYSAELELNWSQNSIFKFLSSGTNQLGLDLINQNVNPEQDMILKYLVCHSHNWNSIFLIQFQFL